MAGTENKKRRHHYVWRHYLEAWARADGSVWCQRDSRRFPAATEKLGVEKDFYRLKEMSDHDLMCVNMLIDKMPNPYTQKLARGWIPRFRDVFVARSAVNAAGVANAKIERELEVIISNLEEDMHSELEGECIPLLAALRAEDASSLNDDAAYITCARFLGMQYMRTPKIMRGAIASEGPFNVEASWGLLRTIFATNIGQHLFLTRNQTRITFLEAETAGRVITGDQPIINLGGTVKFDLYYPLTASLAIRIQPEAGSRAVERRAMPLVELMEMNRRVVRASDSQIYAASEDALLPLG